MLSCSLFIVSCCSAVCLLYNVVLQFVDKYDVVVNCAGLGNYELLNDKKMYPVRGQVLRVRP